MPDDILDVAAAALEGVTEGPWLAVLSGNDRDEESTVYPEGELVPGALGFTWGYDVAVDLRRHDACFIAAARTLVPALVAELEAARAEVERLRARCEPQVYVTTPPCSEYGEGTRGEVRHPIGRCGDPNCGGDW